MKEIKLNQIRINSKNKEGNKTEVETEILLPNNIGNENKAITTKK